MDIKTEKINNYSVVKLLGEFDLNDADIFETEINKIFKERQKIILDFSELEYIDSSGIGQLIQLQRDFGNEANNELYLANINKFIFNVLEIANLTTFFNIISKSKMHKLLTKK